MFVTKQTKVLFSLLVLAFHLAITLYMVGSSEADLNIKALVEGSHEMNGKLWAAVGEDLLWNSVKVEYVSVMKVSSIFGHECRLARD